MSTELTTRQFLEQDNVKARFEELLGKRAPQFLASVLQAINSNNLLQNATPQSVYMAAVTAATLDLPINNNLGFSYIVPFKGQAQFQLGYKGFKQLAQRSGQFLTLQETDVREGELVERNRLTGEIVFDWIQDDTKRQATPIIGYVSYFKLLNGFEQTFYMSVAEIEAHAQRYSQSYKKGFGIWKDNKHEMSLKTVTKLNLSKNAPLSVELRTAVQADQSVITEEGTYNYVDNGIEIIDKEAERAVLLLNDCQTVEDVGLLTGSYPELDSELVKEKLKAIKNG